VEGSLEAKLLTIWTDGKAEVGRVREEKRREEKRREEKRREEERISKKRKSQKKEDPGALKGRKVAKHCVFPMICGSAVVARSTFPSQNVQSTPGLEHFWKLRC